MLVRLRSALWTLLHIPVGMMWGMELELWGVAHLEAAVQLGLSITPLSVRFQTETLASTRVLQLYRTESHLHQHLAIFRASCLSH